MNNVSLFTADCVTHLKIIVVSLLCATMVAGIGVAARLSDRPATVQLESTLVKPDKRMTAANTELWTIR
jgi:hypothetical protein